MGGRQFNSENRVNQRKPENETETNFGNAATKNLLHTITLSVTDWYMPPGPTGGTSARAADPGS